MNELAILEKDFPTFHDEKIVEVGLSGGLDSVVLLHLLVRLREIKSFELRAVHVHHGLSPFADEWLDFCSRLCQDWHVPFRAVKVSVKSNGQGVEAAARAERYGVFADGLSPIIALAHHQNDQIETFMLAVARGGGLRGLAAMPSLRRLNEKTQIWRPLLNWTRQQLEDYATQYGLVYINDESNQDVTYLRNWLRHHALPQWVQRIPNFGQQVLANIRSVQEDLALLDEITQQDYRQIFSDGLFQVDKWRSLSQLRRRRVLHHFFQIHQLELPSRKTIDNMNETLMQSQAASWLFGNMLLEYYRGVLFAIPQEFFTGHVWLQQEHKGRLKDILLQNGFVLKPHRNGLSEEALMSVGIIRKVNNSDALKMPFGHKSTKKMLQESHILPSVRKIWPIITNEDDVCLAIANLKVNHDFQATNGMLPVYLPFERYITELNPTRNVIK